jgi:glycine/D-amino acid oxidase-like deaminating enzyme
VSPSDAIVVGGGVAGAAVAWGLVRRGLAVTVIDQGDDAFRASRANFGLVWVQGKGLGRPEYTHWTRQSSELWAEFAAELADLTGIDCAHERPGGVTVALSEAELEEHSQNLEQVRLGLGNQPYEFEVMDRDRLGKLLPGLGPKVVGGVYCPYDGAANSLLLLRALHAGLKAKGGRYVSGQTVTGIEPLAGGGYAVTGEAGTRFEAGKVVIAAGLGNTALGALVGLDVPVRPVHGQVIVTERAEPLLETLTLSVRQNAEGTFMMGYSAAEIGFDTRTEPETTRDIAWRNSQIFPFLAKLRIVRTWAGLRVMTPDGFPIYEESDSHRGVFVATGHSGVTTAAAHSHLLAGYIAEGALPEELRALSTERFHVPASG